MLCQLGYRPSELDARCATANDHEGKVGALHLWVVLLLGSLERGEDAGPDGHRVGEVLETRSVGTPLGVTEIVRLRSCRDDQVVVGERVSIRQAHGPRRGIDRLRLGHEHIDVGVPAEDGPKRKADVGDLEPRGGYLIEERLKRVVVVAVEEGHLNGRALQRERCGESPEATPDDHDVGAVGDCACLNHHDFTRACTQAIAVPGEPGSVLPMTPSPRARRGERRAYRHPPPSALYRATRFASRLAFVLIRLLCDV